MVVIIGARAKHHVQSKDTTLYQTAEEFITRHRAGALATANEFGLPQVSIVYCLVKPDLTMYFSTRVEGRKFHNLMTQPTVALAFSDEENMATIQMTGIAERIDHIAIEQEILHELYKLRFGDPHWPIPPIRLFENGATSHIAIIKITPIEMTLAKFGTGKTGYYQNLFEKII